MEERRQKVVIVGGGFAGIAAAKALKKANADITLIDRTNHHVFQPLLYQVATAGLSPADIAAPIRNILRGQSNTTVLMDTVTDVDLEKREVVTASRRVPYDHLILATGAKHSYFGHDDWEPYAPGLKTLDDALRIRKEVLLAFERAEMTSDPEERLRQLTFVIIGGGPTGVELAGAITEIATRTLASEFQNFHPEDAKVILVEAGPRLLGAFSEESSARAKSSLEKLGVDVRLNCRVESVKDHIVETSGGPIGACTAIWAAGVQASPVAQWLKVEGDRVGRVVVGSDLTVAGLENVFVLGDVAIVKDTKGGIVPGMCPAAMQQGRYAGKKVLAKLGQRGDPGDFRYIDKGIMATIGRKLAVAEVGGRKFGGFLAWFLWLAIHIWYLIDFENKLLVMIQWAWSYITFRRGARLITRIE
ncbi:MAG: NAD(P)/FAD-dependent oxidoreductase [Fimbriimonadaceae bacterium]|nr:NAD(P)/FAD-dependent oxidoreductase [Fimbriimonadaceae bacterium]